MNRPYRSCVNLALLAGLAVLVASCAGHRGPSVADLTPSVARVSGSACSQALYGSAVAVADGVYLTNAHVVAGAEPDLQLRIPGSDTVTASVVGFDPDRDLALLKVPTGYGRPLPLGSAVRDEPGDIAWVSTTNSRVPGWTCMSMAERAKSLIGGVSGESLDVGHSEREPLLDDGRPTFVGENPV